MSKFYLSPEGDRYYLNKPFKYGDKQYSSRGANYNAFFQLGFDEVEVDPRPDGRFYQYSGPDDEGHWTSTPLDLNNLKLRYIMETKADARRRLSSSDHLLLSGETLPASYETERFNINNISNTRCQEIANTTTVEELRALVLTEPSYPEPINEAAVIAAQYGLTYDVATSPAIYGPY